MILVCKCGVKNRIPSLPGGKRIRCGTCKHVFTPAELTKATLEPPPVRLPQDFELEREDDSPGDDFDEDDD